MIPLQIDEQGFNHLNGDRGRRAFLMIFTLLAVMIILSTVQENLKDQGKVKRPLDYSVCSRMNLNIQEKLVKNNIEYTEPQKKCFNFYLLAAISNQLFRGDWNTSTDQGQFTLRTRAYGDPANQTLTVSSYIFNGEYYDDPHASLQISFNETNQKNITYDDNKRQLNFFGYDTIYSETDGQQQSFAKTCATNLSIQFLNFQQITDSSKVKLQIHVDASECKSGLILDATAIPQNKNYKRKLFLYSCFISSVAILQIYSTLKMLKQLFEHNVQGENYSLISIAMMSAQDAYLSIVHFYFAVNIEIFFHQFITPAFLYFLLFSVFEMRLLIIAWKLRQEEYFLDERFRRYSLVKFYLAYYIFMFSMIYLLFQYSLDSWFLVMISFFIVPQIIHTAIRGQLQQMDKTYTFGLMASRVLIILYFKGCPDNVFQLRPHYYLCLVIIVIVAAQVYIYHMQEKRGPRFFIPKIFLPKKYDYFVEIPNMIDLEIGVSQEVQGLFQEECSVCMVPLHQNPTTQLSEYEEQNIYLKQILEQGSGKIMKTPCDHKFHTFCLAKWMNIKMTCPSCRTILPAI